MLLVNRLLFGQSHHRNCSFVVAFSIVFIFSELGPLTQHLFVPTETEQIYPTRTAWRVHPWKHE